MEENKYLLSLATNGDADAQYELSAKLFLIASQGVEDNKNFQESALWFKKAVYQEQVDAMYMKEKFIKILSEQGGAETHGELRWFVQDHPHLRKKK